MHVESPNGEIMIGQPKFNIIISYHGYNEDTPDRLKGEYYPDELIRTIKFLNKNSYYKHNILIVTDENPEIEFDNVNIIRYKYIHSGDPASFRHFRYNADLIEGVRNVPDEEWICHAYWADVICGKNWDKYIIEEMNKYEAQPKSPVVFTPMFVEILSNFGYLKLTGLNLSADLIWKEWREKISCHCLTMPLPEKEFITEEDMDYFIEKANEAGNISIIENPGDRIYGFFNTMVMKAKFAKKALKLEGIGFDIKFDDRLRDELHMMKVVVCRSFVFHPGENKFSGG